mmetsp:Transcript_34462/g.95018  ORF Transcript_34462/g.95018 Transcript_34462/m.95018 type:complete len:255 (-) Transcript_34462:263-1027(-)
MRALVATASIVAGIALTIGHFGSAVSTVDSCSPSRNAQLQPRWLHGAFESAGVEADARRRRDAGQKSFLRWLTGLMPGHTPEPTFAFLLARWLLIGWTTAVVVAASWNGVRILPWWAIELLEGGLASIAVSGAGAAALTKVPRPLTSLFLTLAILVGVAMALCAISLVPIVVGVLDGLFRIHAVLSERVHAMLRARRQLSVQSSLSKPARQSATVPIGLPVVVGLQPSTGSIVTGRYPGDRWSHECGARPQARD